MQILMLTAIGPTAKKLYIVVDKIVAVHADGDGSVVRLVHSDWLYVKESPEFIIKQLCDASNEAPCLFNSEEHK